MAQKLPKMAQKWRPDLCTFSAIFLSEKAVPQTFSLLECMDCSSCNGTVFLTGCFGGGWVVAMMLMLMVCLVAKRRLPAGRHPSTIPYQLPYRTKHYLATYCTLRLVTPPPCSSSPVLIGTNEEVLIRIIIANIVKLYSGWFHLDQRHCMEFNQSEADLQCNIICINGKVYCTRNNFLSFFPWGLLNQERADFVSAMQFLYLCVFLYLSCIFAKSS